MKALALGAALLLAGCAVSSGPQLTYDNNDLELVAGNSARMACSCLFVMKMDEAYCKAWVKASPDVTRYSVDFNAKRVEASALISWGATARFVDERHGCVLE